MSLVKHEFTLGLLMPGNEARRWFHAVPATSSEIRGSWVWLSNFPLASELRETEALMPGRALVGGQRARQALVEQRTHRDRDRDRRRAY